MYTWNIHGLKLLHVSHRTQIMWLACADYSLVILATILLRSHKNETCVYLRFLHIYARPLVITIIWLGVYFLSFLQHFIYRCTSERERPHNIRDRLITLHEMHHLSIIRDFVK